jgi:uncharacterized protein
MDKVYIPQLLQQPEHRLEVDINSRLPDLETLTPVKGTVTITHQNTYLEVRAEAETIVTLTCHRCLQNYNYRVAISPQELIWLQATPDPAYLPIEQEVGIDDLVETLPPNGYFYPQTWLYEQICLALPQRQICDPNCGGIEVIAQDHGPTQESTVDARWAGLTQLQRQLNESDGSVP